MNENIITKNASFPVPQILIHETVIDESFTTYFAVITSSVVPSHLLFTM